MTSIDVQDGTTQGTYQIETYLPAGAEELAFLVYDSNLDFVGQAGIYKKQDKGYQYFDWNGKVNGDTALPAGEYYMLAYAANKGKSSQVLTENLLSLNNRTTLLEHQQGFFLTIRQKLLEADGMTEVYLQNDE